MIVYSSKIQILSTKMRMFFGTILIIFTIGCGNDHKIKKEFYDNGNIKSEKLYDGNENLNGISKEYFDNGDIRLEMPYKNGVLDGKLIVYYPEGRIKREIFYKEGKLEGYFREYNENGIVVTESNYANNKMQKWAYGYYDNGNIYLKQYMKDSLRDGEYYVFFEDGVTLHEKGNYRYAKKDGIFNIYYRNGNLKDSTLYVSDSLVAFFSFDSIGNYIEGYSLPDSLIARLKKDTSPHLGVE